MIYWNCLLGDIEYQHGNCVISFSNHWIGVWIFSRVKDPWLSAQFSLTNVCHKVSHSRIWCARHICRVTHTVTGGFHSVWGPPVCERPGIYAGYKTLSFSQKVSLSPKTKIAHFFIILIFFWSWVAVSSTGKISYGCIRDLGFNPCLHQKLIGVLVWW